MCRAKSHQKYNSGLREGELTQGSSPCAVLSHFTKGHLFSSCVMNMSHLTRKALCSSRAPMVVSMKNHTQHALKCRDSPTPSPHPLSGGQQPGFRVCSVPSPHLGLSWPHACFCCLLVALGHLRICQHCAMSPVWPSSV